MRIGGIHGKGQAHFKGKSAEIEYNVSVYDDGYLKHGNGTVRAPWKVLMEMMNANEAQLELRDGERMTFMVKRFSPPEDVADIVVSGPVPGF